MSIVKFHVKSDVFMYFIFQCFNPIKRVWGMMNKRLRRLAHPPNTFRGVTGSESLGLGAAAQYAVLLRNYKVLRLII